jgi:hypothetical protein
MIRGLLGVLTLLALTLPAPAFAEDVAAEARSVGLTATGAISSGLSTQPAQDMTPGYTTNPPQASTSPLDVNTNTAMLLAVCQANPSDSTCEAILQAKNDAAIRQATPSMITDPDVQASLNQIQDPALQALHNPVLAGVAAGYSSCGTNTTTKGGPIYATESCYNYYLRSLDQPCTKNLQVSVSWSCSPGATGPYMNGQHYCNRQVSVPVTTTTPGTPATKTSPAGPQIVKVTWVTVTVSEAAIPTVNQWWDNGCAAMEARVPAGMLPPDGQQDPGTQGSATGNLNKCERTTSVCTDALPTTRIIDTVAVSNSCWQYSNTFSCVDNDPRSDCNQPRWGTCQTQGAAACVDYDPIDPSICTATRQDFSCLTADTTHTETSVNCSTKTYTDLSGQVWDTSHAPDKNFGQTVVTLEAVREAGVYMTGTPANLELFKGFDNRCVKKLFGMVNCCNKTGGVNMSMFTNASTTMAAMTAAGKAAMSTYTYDALFVSDAPGMVLQGFEALFGTGYDSALAGVIAGDLSVSSFMTSLVPGPWTIAIIAIQYSGILTCPENQKITSMKRGAGLCVDLGEYCSRKLKWIRTCVERTQSACCFNSKLAKAINVQGKAQLGRSMGGGGSPNCSGFTPDDFTKLDLSKMDFSEFMNDIQAPAINTSSTAARADPAKCYYGNGKCN